ncbi:hypothetical protein ACI513_05825 [Chryseobacterium sp. M5]|uniref:hypothetical protein n=1 Tax=Chryseobacterium sp. M5 TaxID=3379128 RepID=UPI003857C605
MFDKEIEALAKCLELLKDLDDDSKYRVLKYLLERFGNINSPSNFTPNFTNTISVPIQNHQNENQIADVSKIANSSSQGHDYPSIKELLIKNYPKNESEWILCFSFLSSNFGNDTFKKEDIIEKYKEANKWTNEAIRKNLSQNINACIKKDWIKDYTKDEFILKPEGIDYVKEVMNGNSTSKEVKRNVKKAKSNSESNE